MSLTAHTQAVIYGNEYDDAVLKPAIRSKKSPAQTLDSPGLKEMMAEAAEELENQGPQECEVEVMDSDDMYDGHAPLHNLDAEKTKSGTASSAESAKLSAIDGCVLTICVLAPRR